MAQQTPQTQNVSSFQNFWTSTLLMLTSKCLGPATISLYIDRRRHGSAVFGCERRN
jgi:hypothetical protein